MRGHSVEFDLCSLPPILGQRIIHADFLCALRPLDNIDHLSDDSLLDCILGSGVEIFRFFIFCIIRKEIFQIHYNDSNHISGKFAQWPIVGKFLSCSSLDHISGLLP